MKRWIFNFLAGLSLLLFVAVGMLWVRSHILSDRIGDFSLIGRSWIRTDVQSGLGVIGMQVFVQTYSQEKADEIRAELKNHPPALAFDHRKVWPQRPNFSFYLGGDYITLGSFEVASFGTATGPGPGARLVLPYWALAVMASLLAGPWYWERRRRRRRLRSGLCPACGYDLRATPDLCPECGASGTVAARINWRRLLYFVLGWVFVALATLGVFLPLLPTTPFLLLASSCFLRSSPRWQAWLERSRWFGPMLRDWNEHRAVRRPVKVVAIVTVSVVLAFAAIRDLHWAIRAGIFLLGGTGLWVVWRLPVRPGSSADGKSDAARSSSVVTAPLEPADKKTT